MFLAATKMVSFSQVPAVQKDTIFGAAGKIFGSSYFVTAIGMHSTEGSRVGIFFHNTFFVF